MQKETLSNLKEEFIQWCQLITLDEIAGNPELLTVIERVERMFLEF